MLQALTTRFRPYISSKADLLDLITQATSMVSVLVAQYVYALDLDPQTTGNGRQAATVLFVGSNISLTALHISMIAAPLFAKVQAAYLAVTNSGPSNDSTETNKGLGEDQVSCVGFVLRSQDVVHFAESPSQPIQRAQNNSSKDMHPLNFDTCSRAELEAQLRATEAELEDVSLKASREKLHAARQRAVLEAQLRAVEAELEDVSLTSSKEKLEAAQLRAVLEARWQARE